MQFLLNLAIFAFGISSASALGINCRGNGNCGGAPCDLRTLNYQVDQLPDDKLFNPGKHIVCCGDPNVSSGLCVFTQKTRNPIPASQLKSLMQGLVDNGCAKCGSIPFRDGNVDEGELTVNWVAQR